MKTPMQEMLEYVQEEVQLFGSARQILISKIKELLEKEKEVMESAWQDGMYECDGDGTFEDFYKTFNTKER